MHRATRRRGGHAARGTLLPRSPSSDAAFFPATSCGGVPGRATGSGRWGGSATAGGGGGGGGAAVVVFAATTSPLAGTSTLSVGFSSAFASSPFSMSLPVLSFCFVFVVSVGSACAICAPVR